MATLLTLPIARVTDSNGTIYPGALLDVFLTNTTTPTDVYSDDALTTPHANPVVANGSGLLPAIYLDPDLTYRFRFRTAAGANISGMDFDPVSSSSVSELEFLQSGSGAVSRLVSDKLKDTVSPLEFGAAGNGSTNDAAALTAMVTAHQGRFTLGKGLTYHLASGATLPTGFRMLDGRITHADTVQSLGDEWANVFLGRDAGIATTFIPEQFSSSAGFWAAGNHLVFVGNQAGKSNTTGRRNVFVGSRAGYSNTSGAYLTALGSHAFENNTTGFDSTAVGVQAGQSHTTGSLNTFVGVSAGNKITSGTKNVGIGNSSCGGIAATSCTSVGAIGIGFQAAGSLQSGNDQIFIGNLAGQSYQSGDNVICIGGSAGLLLITASNVVAIGASALRNSTASQNAAIGTSAGQALTTGTGNFFGGYQTCLVATTADNTVAVGHQAGVAVTTGDDNTFVGKSAGGTVTTGGTNTCIGKSADTIAAADNSTSLGNGATCTASNQVTLGNASIATLRCQVTSITALSDQRLKTATKNAFDKGLSFILDVKVRDFKWNAKAGKGLKGRRELGVFAQELHAVSEKHGLGWLGLASPPPDEKGQWEATPHKLLFPLIQAVQELAARNAALEERLAKLEAA